MALIDKNEVLKNGDYFDTHWGEAITKDDIERWPEVDAAQVAHARWEHGSGDWDNIFGEYYLRPTYICSNCHEEEKRNSAYCPNCGAKMDLEEPNENC